MIKNYIYTVALISVFVTQVGYGSEVWQLKYEDKFEKNNLNANWIVKSGNWEVKDGKLYGKDEAILISKNDFKGLHKIEYNCYSEDPCDLSSFINSNESGLTGGYFLGFGSNANKQNKLTIMSGHIIKKTKKHLIKPGKIHHVIAEMDHGLVKLTVDNNVVLTFSDSENLWPNMVTEKHRKIGIYISSSGWIDNIKVYTKKLKVPEKLKTESSAQFKKEILKNSLGMELVKIPEGKFEMGVFNWRATCLGDGGEARIFREVTISKSFYLGTTEVTQKQYFELMGKRPSYFSYKNETDNHPVECVSWDQAVEFCKKLSKKENKTYRLPTDAEWEYCYRAGTTTKYFFGNKPEKIIDYGWIRPVGNQKRSLSYNDKATIPVKKLKPNPWGLHDMIGNVFEWVHDWENYDNSYYSNSSPIDPRGHKKGFGKMIRGGSFNWPYNYGTATRGNSMSKEAESIFIGFRVLCEIN
jgi:formylglycine-generating enzyme required for sulfatase activity